MTIHACGNSHCCVFGGPNYHFRPYPEIQNYTCDYLNFATYHIGPVIAYNFLDHHLPMVEGIFKKHVNKETDYVMLVAGEVDCRWHLLYQANKQNRDPKDVAHECATRFFMSYEKLASNGYKCVVWGVHPTTNHCHCESEHSKFYGEALERNRVVQEFNNKLAELALSNSIPFVSVFDKLINKDYTTKSQYYRDYCHLSEKFLPTIVDCFQSKLVDVAGFEPAMPEGD